MAVKKVKTEILAKKLNILFEQSIKGEKPKPIKMNRECADRCLVTMYYSCELT